MKNIILCADGTGNKGGTTPDSNVYKIYNTINLHHPNIEQIIHYDNGVGTQTNKYVRSAAGAFGFGFKTNVSDLYEFLARNYAPGDNIYMFGFSRGAATIRACNGVIHRCGLIKGQDNENKDKRNKQLKKEVKNAMRVHASFQDNHKPLSDIERDELLPDIEFHKETPKITFIGVWDTVSALGFPERTEKIGIGLRVLNTAFELSGWLANKIIPHKFYNYELTPNVEKACQALAIDDARTSFWPMIWKENTANAQHIDIHQVWFAGMHSNIGGGYPRAGLADVSLAWMLDHIEEIKGNEKIPGLAFKEGEDNSAKMGANVNGRMYDSRQGFGAFYRYHPRDITELCEEAGVKVKIHESVMCRLKFRTADYAPPLLPQHMELVKCNKADDKLEINNAQWKEKNRQLNKFISFRKWYYVLLLEFSIGLLGFAGYLWVSPPTVTKQEGIIKHISNTLEYFTPKCFEGFIEYAVVQNPQYSFYIVLFFLTYFFVRKYVRTKTIEHAEELRALFIESIGCSCEHNSDK